MVLLATNSIITIVDVASMNAPVRVETEPGHDPPCKTTSLKRELLSIRLGDTVDGKEGAKFIDGAQFVIAGSGQGGGRVHFESMLHSPRLSGQVSAIVLLSFQTET